MNIGLISHSTAAVAFVVLTALMLLSWRRRALGAILFGVCGITAIWAVVAAWDFWQGGSPSHAAHILEVFRSAGWLIFILSVMLRNRRGQSFPASWMAVLPVLAAVCLALIALQVVPGLPGRIIIPHLNLDVALFGHFILAVAGLLFVENLLRSTNPEHRWQLKFFCLGLGGMYAYDFFLYADALLFQRVNPDLLSARGFINAVVVPLIAVAARRNTSWSLDIFVSRQVIYHSATLIGAGVYLLAMAGAGFYLREVGGEWGFVLQSFFLFAAIMLVLLVVSSGSVRAWIKTFISAHFFSYKYDYRDEWLRFIATISEIGTGKSLPLRVIQGIANIVESPEGAIWLCQGGQRFTLVQTWNCTVPEGEQSIDPAFRAYLETYQPVINLDAAAAAERDPDVVLPGWLSENPRAWLAIPLTHNDRLLGLLVLGRPRISLELVEEDHALLKTVATQAASYLAEQQLNAALAESQQFAEFNRRFAFVLHDIKNLVSQLSLMVQNADKHKENRAFQEDMLETVKVSVDKMNRLLVRLHEGGKEVAANRAVDLQKILGDVANRSGAGDGRLTLSCASGDITVSADEERLGAVIAHIVENSLDAAGETGSVSLRLAAKGSEAIIEVRDNGPGMNAEFVRNELFRPFRSTKPGGFGIGAYESREIVREFGGRLDVLSRPGKGTIVRICLPAVRSEGALEKTWRKVDAL